MMTNRMKKTKKKWIKMEPWIGVDLDGTLAQYDKYDGTNIGKPIPLMLMRFKRWLKTRSLISGE